MVHFDKNKNNEVKKRKRKREALIGFVFEHNDCSIIFNFISKRF